MIRGGRALGALFLPFPFVEQLLALATMLIRNMTVSNPLHHPVAVGAVFSTLQVQRLSHFAQVTQLLCDVARIRVQAWKRPKFPFPAGQSLRERAQGGWGQPLRRHAELEFSPWAGLVCTCTPAQTKVRLCDGARLEGVALRSPRKCPFPVRFIHVAPTLALCLAVLQTPFPASHEAPHLGLDSWVPVLDLALASSLHCPALAFGCRLLSNLYLLPATQNLYPAQHGTRVLAWAHWLFMSLEVPAPAGGVACRSF